MTKQVTKGNLKSRKFGTEIPEGNEAGQGARIKQKKMKDIKSINIVIPCSREIDN